MNKLLHIIEKLLKKENLDEDEAAYAMDSVMGGNTAPTHVTAFLTALKMKGETASELAAFVKTMRKNAVMIAPKVDNLIDTAGTGGDGSMTFNISTCAAFVACGASAKVAKHGNRSASSKSGSADVLEELGVKIDLAPEIVQSQIENIGIGFLFAPLFHPAMKNVALVRKELGFKTVFNILGPLTNPAGAKRQIIGVYDKFLLAKIAEVLQQLSAEKALVVSSDIDEISLSCNTEIYEVSGREVKNYQIAPEDFGFKRANISELIVADKKESARVILDVLDGKKRGAARNIVLLNSGAAIYASGIASSIKQGLTLAEKSIDSGKALEKLNLLRNYPQS